MAIDNPFDPAYVEAVDDLVSGPTDGPPRRPAPSVTYHPNVIQGSDEWLAMRCGLLTASEMKLILTPTLKVADNDKTRAHLWELLFQRITGFVEPQYVSDAMLRGQEDEILARAEYEEHFAPVTEAGFVTNDQWGFTIGYSPDGLVGDDGLLECKSRAGKYQVQTIAEDEVPAEFMAQLQTALLVTGRKWIDFTSRSGGLPLYRKRVEPIPEYQTAIVEAAAAFEARIAEKHQQYLSTIAAMPMVIETERRAEMEIIV